MKKLNYAIESGRLIVRDESSGLLLWSGDFDGCTVFKIVPLAGAEACLVLLDPGSSKQPTFENLLLVSPSGVVHWKARLPRTNDAFTDVVMRGVQIEARTWNGIRVQVDARTGHTKETGFTK